jgi:hypothetical protein
MSDSDKGLFNHQYERFFKHRNTQKGYDFQKALAGNVPPPTVTFKDKLRWWSWDRWKRMKKIREERDRRLQEIIELRKPSTK